MMCWKYIAIDRSGREESGFVDGSFSYARQSLIEKDLAIVALYPTFKKACQGVVHGRPRPLSLKQLVLFFRDLANMFEAGLAINQALLVFQESLADGNASFFCRSIQEKLAQGASLAEAFDTGGVIPKIAIQALHSAERAGRLPEVLRMLADYYEKIQQVRQKITGAVIYPLVVMGLLAGVLVYMSVVVVPQVEIFLPSSAMKGPLTTGLLTVSKTLRVGWPWVLLGGGVLGVAGVLCWKRRARWFEDMFDRVTERLPWISGVKRDLSLSMAFFTLAVLQKSGIPMDAALREVATGSRGQTARAFEECLSCLLGGMTLSEATRRDKYFPRFVHDTLNLGEQMGKYGEYTERVQQVFYRSFVSRMDVLAELVQPVMLCCCAGSIALVALGILGPIYGNLANIGGMVR
jgi:general secretion pathway protein F